MADTYQAGKNLLCGGYSSYTPTGKSYFVKNGRYSTTPHYGDVVYFYTASMGRVSHVGIVTKVASINGHHVITTVEGNSAAGTIFSRDGGEVARKQYTFLPGAVGGGNRINGFGTPIFGKDTCTADDFVKMAESQIGYVEKESAKDLDNPIGNPGDKNYTKYGAWYGLNPAQWCQMFVSWCAWQACVNVQKKPDVIGWVKPDGQSWHYVLPDGTFAHGWQFIDGRWYSFDDDGVMRTGWFLDAGEWYYLADDGGMLSSQWLEWQGKFYYLTASGAMAKSTYVRAEKPSSPMAYTYYWVNEKGEWEPEWDTSYPDLNKYGVAK